MALPTSRSPVGDRLAGSWSKATVILFRRPSRSARSWRMDRYGHAFRATANAELRLHHEAVRASADAENDVRRLWCAEYQ